MNFVEKYYKWIKIIIMVFAYGYLGYILINFKDYAAFNRSFRDLSWERFGLIVSIFLLLPVNWGMEAVKWKTLVSPLQKSSFFQSYKSVLSGLTTGFFTPNRIRRSFRKSSFSGTRKSTKRNSLIFSWSFGSKFCHSFLWDVSGVSIYFFLFKGSI